MKSPANPSIGSRAAALVSAARGLLIGSFICAAAVLAVALGTTFFPTFLSFAAPFAQAGIAVFITAGLLSAARKIHHNNTLQQRRRLVPIRIRRRD